MKKFICIFAILLLLVSTLLISCGQTYSYDPTLFIISFDKTGFLEWANSGSSINTYDYFVENVQPYEDFCGIFLSSQPNGLMYYIQLTGYDGRWRDAHINLYDFSNNYPHIVLRDVSSLNSGNIGENYSFYGQAYNSDIYSSMAWSFLSVRNSGVTIEEQTRWYQDGLTQGFTDSYNIQYEQMANSLEQGGNIGQGAIGGFMSGVSSMFSTVLNGVSVAGVSLLAVVTSVLMIVLCVYLVKVFKG